MRGVGPGHSAVAYCPAVHRPRHRIETLDAATALAVAARAGDERALIALIEATQADVWRFCAHLACPADADDLAQETFIRAVRSLPRFDARSSIHTWLLSIARRVVIDARRINGRRRRLVRALGDVAAAGHVRGSTYPDPAEAVVGANLVDRLPEDRRVAFVLTQILGYSYAEAAEVCRCPVGTIRSRVARARVDLMVGIGAGPADLADATATNQAPGTKAGAEHNQPPAS